MKISAVKRIITGSRQCIILTDAENRQWIGDGKKFYAADENIRFSREMVLQILDVDRDKRDRIAVYEERTSDPRFSIYAREEEERLNPQMTVQIAGVPVVVFATENGEAFAVAEADLKPIDGMGREFLLRRRQQYNEELQPLIAVMADMFIGALMKPLPAGITGSIVETAENVARCTARSYEDEEDDLAAEE